MTTASSIAIVLTGTIIPNTIAVRHADPQKRRLEYLSALRYYSSFGQVYFLENSLYNLLEDKEFCSIPNAYMRKFPISRDISKGKGYQEFEMIDHWLTIEGNAPSVFFKITGRYIVNNFSRIYSECTRKPLENIIIDQHVREQIAITSLFCVNVNFYLSNLKGIYKECNDQSGVWIERVMYKKLKDIDSTFFATPPCVQAISGTSGNVITAASSRKQCLRYLARNVNLIFSHKYLLYH